MPVPLVNRVRAWRLPRGALRVSWNGLFQAAFQTLPDNPEASGTPVAYSDATPRLSSGGDQIGQSYFCSQSELSCPNKAREGVAKEGETEIEIYE